MPFLNFPISFTFLGATSSVSPCELIASHIASTALSMSQPRSWPLSQTANKLQGVCSACRAVRQLHLKDNTVHRHGPRNNPCPGSDKLPLNQPSTPPTRLPASQPLPAPAPTVPPVPITHPSPHPSPSRLLTLTLQLTHLLTTPHPSHSLAPPVR